VVVTVCEVVGHRIHMDGSGPALHGTAWVNKTTCPECLAHPDQPEEPDRPGPVDHHEEGCPCATFFPDVSHVSKGYNG
jgi:hypothetical protein